MRKYFLLMVVALVMVLMFVACGDNADVGITNNLVDTQIENQADMPEENKIDIQTENQLDIREENEADSIRNSGPAADDNQSENKEKTGEQTEMKMNVQIGDYTFTVTLENNTAVEELVEMMKEGPVTISMDDYSGFEKVGPLGRNLTTNNSQTATDAGDIVLYNGNNIVMFYGTNSWSYTRIGKIDDLSDWEKALGSGSITAVFTLAE